MDLPEKLWLDCDVEGALREINAILARESQSNSDINQTLLFSAYMHFQLGKLHKSHELLNKVKFELFELSQWIVENNILVIKYLESKDSDDKRKVMTVIHGFSSLLEKIQGLPCLHDVLSLQLHVSFNFSLAVFITNASEAHIPGGYGISQTKLQQTIERVCRSVVCAKSNQEDSQLSTLDQLRFFWESSDNKIKTEHICLSLAWSCWLLALFWLIDCRVNDAQQLLEVIIRHHETEPLAGKEKLLIFSVMKDGTDVHKYNIKEVLIPACHLALCYASFLNHNKQESLKQCNFCLNWRPDFTPSLLMKGLILYENGQYCDVVKPLQQILESSADKGYRATVLNILGCACAKLGKPHTALVKFRESFASNSGHVEALFNIGKSYHELAYFDREISMWKYILEILARRNSNNVAPTAREINVDFVAGITTRILGDVVYKDHLLISTDIYCVQSSDLRNSQLNCPVILYKIAQSCFHQRRYSEAAEYYVDLLAVISDKPADVWKFEIPSLDEVFKECAIALCKSGRHEDSITVCEKIFLQGPVLLSNETSRTAAKRPQQSLLEDEDNWFKTKSVVEIMLCEAEALTQLQKPLEAYECYERILEVMNKRYFNPCDCDEGQVQSCEPDSKRQKTEMGSNVIQKCDAKMKTNIEEYEKLKALVFNNQGLLLKSFGRKQEALLLFAQSISCQPDCIKYHYSHTSLLFDLGQDEEASRNWLKIRKLKQTEKTTTNTSENKTHTLREDDDLDEDLPLYFAMDSRVAQSSCKKSTTLI